MGFLVSFIKTADMLRGNEPPGDAKHAALGLMLLKSISDARLKGHRHPTSARQRSSITPSNLPNGQHRKISLAQQKCCLLNATAKTDKTAGS